MLIAFEGPDHVGRLEAADRLSGGQAVPKLTRSYYRDALQVAEANKGIVQCFDGIGWLSHLVHRLALADGPGQEADAHTVFTMAETHLVFKLFRRGEEPGIEEAEAHKLGDPSVVNQVYTSFAHTLMALNESQDFALFKSVTIAEAFTDPLDGAKRMEVLEFSSPLQSPWHTSIRARLIQDDLSLFDMLSIEDASL